MKNNNLLGVLFGVGVLGIAYYGYKKSKLGQTQKASSEMGETITSNFSGDMSSTGSFSPTSGYQKFPSGLIIQFGYGGKNVQFPIPFPNACNSVSVTTNRKSSGSSGFNHATNVSLTGFTQIIDGTNGYWIAIGH